MQKNSLLYCLLIVVLLSACGKGAIYEKYRDIPGKSWVNKETVVFDMDMEDTTQSCNLIVRIRFNSDYPFRNLFIFLNTQYPDGKQSLDTLEFYLLDELGRPMAECSGDICDAKFKIRENVKFPQKGTYTFRFFHDMRTPENTLTGLTDIGMRVEKYP